MFDFHMHSRVSFDSKEDPAKMVEAAEKAGLLEMCFTDHYDFNDAFPEKRDIFTLEDYNKEYAHLNSDKVKIRRGVEAGLTHWNMSKIDEFDRVFKPDFIIGSVHYAGGFDPYCEEYWVQNGLDTAFEKYLLQSLECVKAHDNFDVLGHINYVCKSAHNPTKKPLYYSQYADICDEIMKTVADKGIGLEINTSGVDRVGDFLPSLDYIKRFKELGGEIITVGSDAHDSSRVGQYVNDAILIAKEVFGYVCTFENRKPIFHKL